MNKSFAIALAFTLSALSSGCATFSNGTLASELVNDHEPGSTSTPATTTASLDAPRGTRPEGAACIYGPQCRSGYCSNNVCEDLNGDGSDDTIDAGAVLATK
ncbi:MAG: hypothetical protein JST54_21500 [Deltaproteobacteria bacterium]|nr:hypothetical protein [Deltaproteobacteria bacterium]